MRKKSIRLIYLFIFATIISASPSRALGIAKYAGEFLSTGVGARALGMGGAYVAVDGDVTSGYWNPAGLADITYPELAAMHSRRFGGIINYDYAGLAMPFRTRESFAINVIRLAVDDIPITALPRPGLPLGSIYTDSEGNVIANRPYVVKMVNDAEYALFLSYARRHDERLAFGANVKFIYKGVGDNSAWGLGFDIGAIWNPVDHLRAAANLQDLTTTLLAWNNGTRELIAPTLKLGLAYPLFIDKLRSRVLFAGDTDIKLEGRQFASQAHAAGLSMDFHLGAEFLISNVIALRLGRDAVGKFSAGAGLRLPRLDFDYAFMGHDQLETTHRISLRVRIEEQRFARK